MPAETFRAECRDFADRLLQAMSDRIDAIAAGSVRPSEPVDIASVRKQHEVWRTELAEYFGDREPDISWEETEDALRAIAAKHSFTSSAT